MVLTAFLLFIKGKAIFYSKIIICWGNSAMKVLKILRNKVKENHNILNKNKKI